MSYTYPPFHHAASCKSSFLTYGSKPIRKKAIRHQELPPMSEGRFWASAAVLQNFLIVPWKGYEMMWSAIDSIDVRMLLLDWEIRCFRTEILSRCFSLPSKCWRILGMFCEKFGHCLCRNDDVISKCKRNFVIGNCFVRNICCIYIYIYTVYRYTWFIKIYKVLLLVAGRL